VEDLTLLYPGLGDTVRVVDGGKFHFEEGRIISYSNGQYGVVFEWDTTSTHYYEPMHLERI